MTGVTGAFSTSYGYNVKGDLTQMTYPSGRVVNFGYATGGGCCNSRLSSVADATTSVTLANGMTYEPSGAINARTLNPDGSVPLAQTFGYNSRLQQTQVRAAEGSTYVMDFSYDYGTTSNVGQLLSRTDAIQPEHSVNYGYDSIYRLSQLTSADGAWGIAWTFDGWSNRLTQTPQGFLSTANIVGTQSLAYTNNRLSGQTYDAAGNVTNDGGSPTPHTYTYNGKNQITRIDGSSTDNYLYDGEGRRMKKTIGGASTFYFYGPGGIISEFTTTTGATAASSSDKTCYETSDRQGTAVLSIASNGLVIENSRTLPYGELWSPQVASATTKKFTTYERDQESNLDYAINRYLANNYGRFMSSDKGGVNPHLPIMLNRYLYTLDNPVNGVDPDGNITICDYGNHYNENGNFDGCNGIPMPTTSDHESPCWELAPGGCDGGEDGGGGGSPPPEVSHLDCEKSAGTNTIMADADKNLISFTGYTFQGVTIAGLTGGGQDQMTELFMSIGSDPGGSKWAALTSSLDAAGFKEAGWDPLHGDYDQSYRQMTRDGKWSMQVSFDSNHNLQIDIDEHNPMQGKMNALRHFGDVVNDNMRTKDTNYHKAAQALKITDTPCPPK